MKGAGPVGYGAARYREAAVGMDQALQDLGVPFRDGIEPGREPAIGIIFPKLKRSYDVRQIGLDDIAIVVIEMKVHAVGKNPVSLIPVFGKFADAVFNPHGIILQPVPAEKGFDHA